MTGLLKKQSRWLVGGYLKPLYQLRTASFINSECMNIYVCMYGGTVIAPTKTQSRHSLKDQRKHQNISVQIVVPQQRFEPGTSSIKVKRTTPEPYWSLMPSGMWRPARSSQVNRIREGGKKWKWYRKVEQNLGPERTNMSTEKNKKKNGNVVLKRA